MKTSLLLTTLFAGANAATNCNDLLESTCGNVGSDYKAAYACLTEHNSVLVQASCQLPAEALSLLRMAVEDQEGLAQGLRASDMAAVVTVDNLGSSPASFALLQDDSKLPTVFAHGMGDSCFNSGMKQITADTGKHIGSYAVCVPTGDNVISDTINGFLLNMDKSVDVFAAKIQKDPQLGKQWSCCCCCFAVAVLVVCLTFIPLFCFRG